MYNSSQGFYTQEELLIILVHLLDALSELQAEKILHRDLKSANIIIFQKKNH
jgi:serine/threonine protein kinase